MRGYKYLVVVASAFSIVNAHAAESDMLKAKKLYERMTGVKVSSTKPELKQVAELIAKGDTRGAANYITGTSDFLNVQIKNLSLKLSNKDESVKVPFNDFSALIVGVVRDGKDFRDILTADYFYDVKGVPNETDQRTRMFNQANYTPVETSYMNLQTALVQQPRQKMVKSAWSTPYLQSEKSYEMVSLDNNPEPAGVFTTRTFAERNLSGGTNRRAVEFSLKQFLCVSMAEAADSSASDQYVGRDVERFPAGDHNKYLTSCKSCHSVMDGMRGAFAKMDYTNFTTGGATGTYSQMNGDFFNQHGIQADYNTYNTNYIAKVTADILPDLVNRQENSTWFTTRLAYLIKRGTAEATARGTLMGTLDTIRDPAVANAIAADFSAKKASVLADIKAKRTTDEYKNMYTTTCVNHFGTANITDLERERRFLICNLDNKREMSLMYIHYESSLSGASEAERTRLLGKLINKGRPANINLVTPYLEAREELRLFPRNVFDSSTGVAAKMNKGSYPYGFVVNSDNFVNNAVLGSKSTFFGWRGGNAGGGQGVKDFGKMLSQSRRFSQCMAKRVYESVCLKKLESTQYSTLVRLGDRFEAVNYNLKSLYTEVALDPVCGVVKEE
ncbi:hypothetical protein [Bdellovibrio bacteriovorus]|uniref:hypothetical protein n=1 Tax=Bdellovibrio bacteriovorus TaxID=959 RepID=UPI00045BF16A|nr:hypothetical protein [Bdellovibrio bacteriovorus]AHZ85037.1 hypothetical protein EP01_08810 [Bdellovibrio bacteriovorus]BEV68925.1 hypothetical protein Bb109J_c2345 [Bdellovibrio bacteriovorus]